MYGFKKKKLYLAVISEKVKNTSFKNLTLRKKKQLARAKVVVHDSNLEQNVEPELQIS